MPKTIFLAGASGAVGRRLVPMLRSKGWRVVGLTRSLAKCEALTALGAEPVVADVFDAEALRRVVVGAGPTVVIHQLTDLPPKLDPTLMEDATARNARIREEGTRNLVAAAIEAGARRIVAQSVAFAYADGPLPHREDDALALQAAGRQGVSARGVASLERQVLDGPLEGLVLRYGRLYGSGTGFYTAAGTASVHVDAAAYAAVLAAERGENGLYNIAEDDSVVSSEKAKQQWGWSAAWRYKETGT
ncbi:MULTISPECIES: NAD-dependent epimerase/dehydratase family protein [unclassified Aureimonas]|uniref:NAD-dependent epimerase/dehydratase family protein n=1 Tax=unclassified Aureimonas TaxID=2615206 RepID=UPI0006F6FD6C|nr:MULTISPECIES: NAD(P)H-binding protein [unclassified Aureimonas]KQT63295.1 dTDP-glucose 4,6-dehydratase [Aureimonas sp. Leaf427]KQT80125.1 dTDP-glucose 4,6-dehydratase [Aureimonas sp. Leaf460]